MFLETNYDQQDISEMVRDMSMQTYCSSVYLRVAAEISSSLVQFRSPSLSVFLAQSFPR